MKLLDKILIDAKEFGIEWIYLEFWGEPFLHPRFNDMVTKTSGLKFKTKVYTNGLLIKDKHMEVIPGNMDQVCFSIDGASEETYSLNRIARNGKTGNFKRVWDKIIKLNDLCAGTKTKVTWQFIVLSNNEHEIPKAKEMAKENNLQLVLKLFNPSVDTLISKNKIVCLQI